MSNFNVDWKEILSLIQLHINFNNGTFANHSDEVFEIITFLLLSDPNLFEQVKPMVTSGQYLNLLFHRKEQNTMIAAISFAFILKSEMHSITSPVIGNSANGLNHLKLFWKSQDEESAKNVLDYLLEFNQFEFLWFLIEKPENILVSEIFRIALKDKKKFKQVFVSSNCLERMKIIDNVDTLDSNETTPIFLSNNDIEKQIISNLELNIKEYSKQILDILRINKSEKMVTHIFSRLLDLKESDWDEEFKQDTCLLKLAIEIKSAFPISVLRLHYHDSLYNFTKNLDGISEWKIQNWDNIIDLLSDTYKKEFIEKATQYFIANKDNTPSKFIELNGKYLNKEKIFKTQSLFETMVVDLLEQNEFKKLELLLKVFTIEDTKKLLKADKGKITIISDRIKSIMESDSYEENKRLIQLIIEIFKIRIQ